MKEGYAESLERLNRAIERMPKNARFLAHRGECHRQESLFDEALTDFSRAIALNPNYSWALTHRGETYRQLARYEDALRDFDQALILKPRCVWALAHRGAVYCELGRGEEALTELNLAIALRQDYAWALTHRAKTFIMMKRYEEALGDADRALELDGAIVSNRHGERGLLLNYLGRYGETIACCQPAVRENPKDYVALYSLAVALTCAHGGARAEAARRRTLALLQTVAEPNERGSVLYRMGGLAALEDHNERALSNLRDAIRLDSESLELARHDPAWLGLRRDRRFHLLIQESPAATSETATNRVLSRPV